MGSKPVGDDSIGVLVCFHSTTCSAPVLEVHTALKWYLPPSRYRSSLQSSAPMFVKVLASGLSSFCKKSDFEAAANLLGET